MAVSGEDERYRLGARALAAAIRARDLSARDTVASALARIERLDSDLKAFITLAPEAALAAAAEADAAAASDADLGPLHGVPIAIKDLARTAGMRTTYGSCRHAEFVPEADDLCVARLRAAGAIIVGKTNTPEFGFGAVNQNLLFGPTSNPFDPALTSGTSSGGSAVAVTTGMVPLAHGTDFGGSVRTPASFCGVVGVRPTPGRIPDPGRPHGWNILNTDGVLAQNVGDAALMLAVMSGPDPRDPTSLLGGEWMPPDLSAPTDRTLRVAWSVDLGGVSPIDNEVAGLIRTAVARIGEFYPDVVEACPETGEAAEAFQTLRAGVLYATFADYLERGRDDLTETFVWNVARGEGLSANELFDADATRTRVYRDFATFFERHDILALPAACVAPYPNAQGNVSHINGKPLENIIDYLRITFVISLIGFPALSIPCGFTAAGLPVGLQLVARPYDEARLLRFAADLEADLGFRHRWPPAPYG